MVETAAHLADHVFPRLPLRQWVLAAPKRLRYFLHRDPDLQGAALRLFLGAVEQCLRAHRVGAGPATRLGAVAFIHRFGSALNAHLHFHCVLLDGVFASTLAGGVVCHPATGLDGKAITALQATVRRRLLASFVRRPRPAAADPSPLLLRRAGSELTAAPRSDRHGVAGGDARPGRATRRPTGPPPRRPIRLGRAARPRP